MILTQSKNLRQLTVLLFYFTQGFPIGIFFYAVPAWMAAHGATTGQIAGVVASATLPWSLKLVNGFLIDRYTFLAMGRRRAWIIGAQSLLVGTFLLGAAIAPLPTDIVLLSAIAFAANAAVTFQDVGIDSLVVDIMTEEERSHASGFMYGAQVLGIAGATAVGGKLFASFGFQGGMLAAAAVPAAVLLYGIAIREREGERRLPWSRGEAHPDSRAIHAEAWLPLLKNAFKALFAPLSLLLVPVMIARALPHGGFEAFHPVLFTQTVGWALEEWTAYYSQVTLAMGIFGLFAGGWLVGRMGAQRAMIFGATMGCCLLVVMASNKEHWADPWFAAVFVAAMDFCAVFYFIAAIPMCMRMCSPAVAATQFTIYMAIANFGRPIGASLAAVTAGQGYPEWLYWCSAIAWGTTVLVLLCVRFPEENRQEHATAAELPQGEGPVPRVS
ncbi:MFS transporter [Haliea sp. E17]|uniref:MFS transporter n=1 Tax=Haliea sp. E17 TaxID=3401576 RepID=UPI003AB053F6